MPTQLTISLGQYSDKGRKEINQDFHGAYIPKEPQLSAKGIAIALADGISTSSVSQAASEAAVKTFLDDYFCTSDAWTVKKSAQCVLNATNSWLHSQTQQSHFRHDKERGYVCTFSGIVIKSNTLHIFHVGDSRIYRLHATSLEQLTQDHRVWVTQESSHLSRALGVTQTLDIDYHASPIEKGEILILATDGIYEFVAAAFIIDTLRQHGGDLNHAAKIIADEALIKGSDDNLTIQIVRIDELPNASASEVAQQISSLQMPPILEPRMRFDGFTIIRSLHASSRSHVYLATDDDTQERVVIKTPSIDLREDAAYLERFLLEDWIARRINSAHVLKACSQTRKRNYVYVVTEFIEGQTLTQWMTDNPKADLEAIRNIVEQIAKGLQAFHRMEMLHQDLRPQNVMIDRTGTVKIIDFGSTKVAGIVESTPLNQHNQILGTAQYTAPEYFLGENGTAHSDLFSLGVIAYQMISGKLPYGIAVSNARTVAAQRDLVYQTVLHEHREIPAWVDQVLKKAVHINPYKRYAELSEFAYDLRHPNQAYLTKTRAPLIERNPVAFWKGLSFILLMIVIALLARGH